MVPTTLEDMITELEGWFLGILNGIWEITDDLKDIIEESEYDPSPAPPADFNPLCTIGKYCWFQYVQPLELHWSQYDHLWQQPALSLHSRALRASKRPWDGQTSPCCILGQPYQLDADTILPTCVSFHCPNSGYSRSTLWRKKQSFPIRHIKQRI